MPSSALPPPPIVAPATPLTVELFANPPMRLGLAALGSSRRPRRLFTRKSSAWLSVVPRNCTFGVMPALPLIFQRLVALTPPTVVAFTLVTPAPLPRSEEHTSELQSRENLVC